MNLIGTHRTRRAAAVGDADPWHAMPQEQVLEDMASHLDTGLTSAEVQKRLEQYGHNILPRRRPHGPIVRFLLQFHQPLMWVLLIAGGVTAALGEWPDSTVIFGVVLVNAIVGFIQESRALQAMEALARALTSEAMVIRDGRRLRISSTEIVPGDVVVLESGDKVAADLRLIRTRELTIDESTLTGESVPVEKSTAPLAEDTILADRVNMAYGSTLVARGQGVGVAVATGEKTEIGRISALVASADELQTPLTRKIAQFSHRLLYIILLLAGVTFLLGIIRGEHWFDMFMAAVGLAVAAIPEGLPAVITITLAIGVSRMARRRVIIRRLPAVEALGSTTIICSDKTGTLTQNQMTVQGAWAGGSRYEVSGGGYAPEGEVRSRDDSDPRRNAALLECIRAGVLCNDTSLNLNEEGRWQVSGDPTEAALIPVAEKLGMPSEGLRKEWRRLDTVPFESQRQFMGTLHAAPDGSDPVIYVKGSVEAILGRCRGAIGPEGEVVPLDAEAAAEQVRQMAERGLRVLAFARGSAPGKSALSEADLHRELVFLGLQGMMDPPRGEAIKAISACHTAGIRVKMITGDHAVTAQAIAGQMGLLDQESVTTDSVLPNQALAAIPDEQLPEIAEKVPVFARVTPEQKLRLVKALQQRGHIVAMTGDGVNDAPALRQASIGVAMGAGGTEVAKEASDMVLTDDNFASIEAAVEEGRGVFDNLTKFIVWTLPTNAGESLVILGAVLLGLTMPILPAQILWINMSTALCLGLMLAFEPREPGIMERPPRDPNAQIITGVLLRRIVLVGVLLAVAAFWIFEWELARGSSEAQARTAAATAIVMGETFYLLNCRSLSRSIFAVGILSSKWIISGMIAMFLLQLTFTQTAFMNMWFRTEPMDLTAWTAVVLVGIGISAIVAVEKAISRRMARGTPGPA